MFINSGRFPSGMKIVHVIGYFMPELGYQEYYLAKKHAEQGHDVYVICSDLVWPFPNAAAIMGQAGAEPTRRYKPGFYNIDGIKVYRLKHLFEYNDFVLVKGIKQLLQEIKPDIVFSHESRQGMTAVPALYKKRLKYRYVVDQHDFYHPIPNYPLHKRILRWADYNLFRKRIVSFNLKRADKIIAVTEETKNFLVKKHKIKNVDLIPLGVDADLWKFDLKNREKIRGKYGVKKNETLLIFSGTIFKRKRLELLIGALKETDNKNLKLFVTGDGDKGYIESLREEVNRLGLKDRIIFTGLIPRKNLPKYFSAADIGIWPGNNSVAIIEGMACRLPIIMVDLQLGHLVKANGFKFRDGDKRELVSILNKIKGADLKGMGENSCKTAVENYSYDAIARKFLDAAYTRGQ